MDLNTLLTAKGIDPRKVKPHRMSLSSALAIKICRCDDLPVARTTVGHPCHRIARFQRTPTRPDHWQVPEPWRGNLQDAPLLFVSSNPSVDTNDDSPWDFDTDGAISAYFNSGSISKDFPMSTSRDAVRSPRHVQFWSSVHARAKELFDNTSVRHGIDYAITEVVHCKSTGETGVDEAREHCAYKYLQEVLSVSTSSVLVALGRHAAKALDALPTPPSKLRIDLPHPNARAKRTASACLSAETLRNVRSALAQPARQHFGR